MTVHADGSVRHEVVVDLPPGEAFWKFADLDRIKPREHNMLAVAIEETVLEQRAGGDVYDRGVDGSICRWGRVLVFDPPHAIAFSWDIGPDWQVTSDLDRASEVEATFAPVGDGQTRVTLVHRHIDRHGSGWESLRDGLEAPDGWPLYLDRYKLFDPRGSGAVVTRADLMPLAELERGDLLALLRELTPSQWEASSLCTDWSVREVATHVVSYDELSKLRTAATFLRGGLRTRKVNEVALGQYRTLDPEGIVDLVARCQRPRGLPAAMGGGIALTDGTIHHQDIRRALGMPRNIPEDRLIPVLDFSIGAPTLPSKSNRRGLRLIATDIAWSAGDGPEVSGPGEALLLAVAGRPDALNELSGDGLSTLRERVQQSSG